MTSFLVFQSFKEMIANCLVKDPTKRPTAKKLLKHSFFKQARSNDYISRKLLDGLPTLGDRTKAMQVPNHQTSFFSYHISIYHREYIYMVIFFLITYMVIFLLKIKQDEMLALEEIPDVRMEQISQVDESYT